MIISSPYRAVYVAALFVLIQLPAYSQAPAFKDPFESYLPRETEGYEQGKRGSSGEDLGPPPITIQGILWGTGKPLAIIDGDVYGVGDTMKNLDAKIFKIQNNVVFITYGERIFEMSVKTRGL